ncbi:MAG: MarR family transcriptional regulator [Nanoarchaeota archaeon]|nr:MarR family transcriptional regulator [Nanoarchaeota archaeon]
MENKKVGWLVIGIALAIAIMTVVFNYSMRSVAEFTCTHGSECSMYSAINFQLWLGIAIVMIVFSLGAFIMYSKPEEKTVIKKVKEKKKKLDLSKLDSIEKKAIKMLINENNGMFQSDLMEKLEIGKVKVTRMLDKLEAKGFVIRKRRGMNNIVLLQDTKN